MTHPSVCNKEPILDKLLGGLVNVNNAEYHILSMSLLDIPRVRDKLFSEVSRESVSWENSINAMWEKKRVHNSLIRPSDFHRHLFKCKWGVYSMGGASAST